MRINRAIGLGIAILVLQLLMGSVFAALEHTLIATFDFAGNAIGVAEEGLSSLPANVEALSAPHFPTQ